MVPGCQGLGGDEGGQPSNSPDLIDQKSDSECVRESARVSFFFFPSWRQRLPNRHTGSPDHPAPNSALTSIGRADPISPLQFLLIYYHLHLKLMTMRAVHEAPVAPRLR